MAVINSVEKAVLGILLDNPDRIDEAGLIPAHFQNATARKIYTALTELRNKGKPTDPLSVAMQLEDMGVSHISGSDVVAYILGISDVSIQPETLGHYCGKLVSKFTSRKAAQVAEKIQKRVLKGDPGEQVIEEAIKSLQQIDTGGSTPLFLSEQVEEERQQIRNDIKQRAAGLDIVRGLPIGMGLDRICPSGLPIDCVGVLCGDTKSGKTTVAQNIAINVAQAGYGVIFFTVEDSLEIFRQKALSAMSGVPLRKIITRGMLEDDIQRVFAAEVPGGERLIVDGTPGPTHLDIIRRARQYSRSFLLDSSSSMGKVGLVIVDYLQILARSSGNEREALREAMLAFQHAAKADRVHYLIVSQLNRAHLLDRDDPRPRRQDLYGSGSIEQFSKLIIGVHRPARFGSPKEGRHYEEGEGAPDMDTWADRLELWVIGNNKGEDNVFVNARWNRETGRIVEE